MILMIIIFFCALTSAILFCLIGHEEGYDEVVGYIFMSALVILFSLCSMLFI